MGGGGSRQETRYEYVDNTDRDREAARKREADRLAKEREQRELEEKNRIQREKKEEEERRKAQYRQQRQREQAQEEAKIKEERRKRLLLENVVRRSRDELFKYKFGSKTTLDSFRGLAIDDVTKLRIGVFGPTGSGKSCFINTCERAVRQTDKGSAPDSTTGNEGTIILQDFLYEMFFRLVDTRGFFNYNANETIEFEDILEGRVKPGDNLLRQQPGMKAAKTAPAVIKDNDAEFCDKLHGVIIVVKANDSRLKEGRLRAYLQPARDILRRKGIAPMTVVTHRDELQTKEDCDNAKLDASAATGSSLEHVFFMANYTKQNSARNLDTERMAFDILHYALLSAERAVKLMKQKLKNAEEDEMMRELEKHSVSGQVAPDSANASVEVFLRHLQKEYEWSTNSVREVVARLSKDDVTSVTLLASCWKDVQNYFILGMRAMVEKELKNRGLIPS